MEQGKFIVLEGIDGSGTTTQRELLGNYLRSVGREVLVTFEPTEHETGRLIRKRLGEDENPRERGEDYAEMFVADRKCHLEQDIIPALERGMDVVCDRYKYSTLAYQWTQGVDLGKLKEMNEICRVPDIVFLVDVPVEVALERIRKRAAEGGRDEEGREVFERKKDFLEDLRANYLALSSELPEEEGKRMYVIDGNKPEGEVLQEIIGYLRKVINLPGE